MAIFTSQPVTVTLDAPSGPFSRADLEFHGIDHARASYEARIFFDNSGAGPDTPKDAKHGYAGSFYVFGHGGCAGDEGHCEVPTGPARPSDLRPEHQLTTITQRVIVTEPMRRLAGKRITVSVVPVMDPADAADLPDALVTDLLHFDRINVVAYQ